MDPVSIIGLVGAIANIAEATGSVVTLIKSFKDGERDLLSLSNDLSAFSVALDGFHRVLRSKHTIHRIPEAAIRDMLSHTAEHIRTLEARLRRILSSDYAAVRRAKWVQHKSSIAKLHSQLKEQHDLLHSFLSIVHAETFMAITSSYPQLMLSDAASGSHQTSNHEPTIDSPTTDPASLQLPRPDLRARRNSDSSMQTFDTTSDSTASSASLARLSLVSSTSSRESLSSWGSQTSDSVSSDLDAGKPTRTLVESFTNRGSRLILTDMWVTRRSCRYDCRCNCHEQNNDSKSPRRLGRLKNRTVQCSDAKCEGNLASTEQTSQYSSLFRETLSQVMSSRTVQVRPDLKTFRMVPEGSDAMRHVKHGNLDKLKLCIESGEATIWDTAPDGWSLLHTAAYNRQPAIVKYLLELGVDTNAGDVGSRKPGDLALLKSISQDATHVEQQILEAFTEKDDVLLEFDFTPIHIAVLRMYDPTDRERPSLEELIDLVDDANNAPANTNWAEWKLKFKGRSPLFSAVIEYFRSSAFGQPKGTKIIHNLLDQKDKKYDWTPLHWAASSGHVEEMKVLVAHGADPTILSNLNANILHAASESKTNSGLVGALEVWERCSDRLDINQVNRWVETPLHVASWTSAACVRVLLEAGADPGLQEENGQVPLHCAGLSEQSADRRQIVSLFCTTENKAHLNTQDLDGRPPVFDFLDDSECVKLLLENGASLDLSDNEGRNVFHHVCSQGESDTLAVLLSHASNDSNPAAAKCDSGNTPLIEALSSHHVECALALLKLEDVGDTVGNEGWAPVHYAAKIGDIDLLRAVLQHSSFSKGMRTMDGKRVSDVAMEAGHWQAEFKKLIREYDYL